MNDEDAKAIKIKEEEKNNFFRVKRYGKGNEKKSAKGKIGRCYGHGG